MVHWALPYTYFFLLSISTVKVSAFSACANYIFTSAFYNSANVSFKSQLSDSTKISTEPSQTNDIISPAISCSSIYMNNYAWSLLGGYTNCASKVMFGLGFWINFESTIGTNIMQFGSKQGYPNTFTARSDTEGTLIWTFEQDENNKDVDDFSITVNRNQWTFLAFNWLSSYFYIYIPGQDKLTQQANGSTGFSMPTTGDMLFGKDMKAHIYQVIGFFSVPWYEDNFILHISDGNKPYQANYACPESCPDQYCHTDQKCLSQTSDCTACSSTGCSTCQTANPPSTYCNLICPSDCAKCSSSTLCTRCSSGFFLYDNAAQTTCISCDSSCHDCNPGPTCFECADSVIQNDNSCRVDKVGFQLSFSSPNIEIEFAHPLVSNLIVSNLTATSSQGTPISTAHWTLNPCTAGSSSCIIATDNLSESQLPLDIDFYFGQSNWKINNLSL